MDELSQARDHIIEQERGIVGRERRIADLEQELSTLLEAAQAAVDEWRNTCSTEAIRALESVLEDKAGST